MSRAPLSFPMLFLGLGYLLGSRGIIDPSPESQDARGGRDGHAGPRAVPRRGADEVRPLAQRVARAFARPRARDAPDASSGRGRRASSARPSPRVGDPPRSDPLLDGSGGRARHRPRQADPGRGPPVADDRGRHQRRGRPADRPRHHRDREGRGLDVRRVGAPPRQAPRPRAGDRFRDRRPRRLADVAHGPEVRHPAGVPVALRHGPRVRLLHGSGRSSAGTGSSPRSRRARPSRPSTSSSATASSSTATPRPR